MVTYAPIACKHQVSGSFSLPSRGPFHLSLTVLFSIGHLVVFRLGGWAPRLQTGFHVSGPTLVSVRLLLPFDYGAFTLFGGTFQSSSSRYPYTLSQIHNPEPLGFGLASFPFARRYLGNRVCFLFLRVLRCFSSPRFLLVSYVFTYGYMSIKTCEFPHSEISGSRDMCSSPELIAACHVLLRLQVPRHPPNALLRLNYFLVSLGFSVIICNIPFLVNLIFLDYLLLCVLCF